jgi:hypothetical protein
MDRGYFPRRYIGKINPAKVFLKNPRHIGISSKLIGKVWQSSWVVMGNLFNRFFNTIPEKTFGRKNLKFN